MTITHHGVKVGRVFGAPVYLRRSWFAFMAVVIIGYGLYISQTSLATVGESFIVSTTVAMCVAVAVFVHELAHAGVGLARGQQVQYISMTLWGGLTKLTQGKPSTSFWVAIAGPFVNLLFALVGYLILGVVEPSAFAWGLRLAADANLAIFFFNLLPSYPLDGGHALESAVQMMGFLKSSAIKVTAWCGLALIPLVLLLALLTGWLRSPLSMVVLTYLVMYIWRNGQAHLKSLKHQSSGIDPLQVKNFMQPAVVFDVSTPLSSVVEAATHGMAVVCADTSGQALWVPPVKIADVISDATVGQVAVKLAQPAISHSALRYDLMDYLNGHIWQSQPQELRQGRQPLAWPVTDHNGRIIGIIDYAQAGEILYRESQYLRGEINQPPQ